jgi:hypothetical protein
LLEGFTPESSMYGPAPDPIRERVSKNHPADSAELEAEVAVERATDAYNRFLGEASKRQRDLGESRGFVSGFVEFSENDREAYETVRENLANALRRRNALHGARKRLIEQEIAAEGAKEALKAQAAYQRARGIEVGRG